MPVKTSPTESKTMTFWFLERKINVYCKPLQEGQVPYPALFQVLETLFSIAPLKVSLHFELCIPEPKSELCGLYPETLCLMRLTHIYTSDLPSSLVSLRLFSLHSQQDSQAHFFSLHIHGFRSFLSQSVDLRDFCLTGHLAHHLHRSLFKNPLQ